MRAGIAVLTWHIRIHVQMSTTVYQYRIACTSLSAAQRGQVKLKVDAPTKLIFMTTDFCIRERELVNKARGKVTLKHLLE